MSYNCLGILVDLSQLQENYLNTTKKREFCPEKLIIPSRTSETEPLLIELSEKFHCSGYGLVARSLVAPIENVMIRQMNLYRNNII